MSSLISKLEKLDIVILKNLESSIVSIYKINKEHHLFQPILDKHPQLVDAEYIIYPNLNSTSSKIFLAIDGSELLTYNGGISEFILLPSDLETRTQSLVISASSCETNSLSNYSW